MQGRRLVRIAALVAGLAALLVGAGSGRARKGRLEQLARAARSGPRGGRIQAVRALGRLGSRDAVRILVQVMADRRVRKAAVEALEAIPPRVAMPALAELLGSQDERTAWDAGLMLSGFGRAAVPALVRAIRRGRPEIRRRAARALSDVLDPGALWLLLGLVPDRDRLLREAALDALGEIGDPRAVPGLLRALEANPGDDEVAEALTELVPAGAVGILRALVATRNRAFREALMAVVEDARPAPAAVPYLLGFLRAQDHTLCLFGLRVLSLWRVSCAVPHVESIAQAHPDTRVRFEAVWALRRFANRAALRALERLTRVREQQVRAAARRAVQQLAGAMAPGVGSSGKKGASCPAPKVLP